MIKVTHIQPQFEEEVCKIIGKELSKKLDCYFEVKTYGNGVNTAPTFIFKRRL